MWKPTGTLRKVVVVLGWIAAVFAFVGGLGAAWSAARFPQELAHHPVRAQAVVTDSYINGFGGDPTVDYRYAVDGHTYRGSGPSGLRAGETVAIHYALTAPSKSCLCNPKYEAPDRTEYALDAVFMAPLVYLLVRKIRRRRSGQPVAVRPS